MFSETYIPVINGVVSSTVNFKKALEKRGHEVFIFTSKNKNADPKQDARENIFRCPGIHVKSGYNISFPHFFNKKAKEIMEHCDIIHMHHPFLLEQYALKIAKKRHIPSVFTVHTRYDEYSHYFPILRRRSAPYVVQYVANFAKKCDEVITPSESMRQMIINEYGVKNVRVVPNGIPEYAFSSLKTSKIKEDEFKEDKVKIDKVKKEKNTVIFAGRLAEEKNLMPVLIAFEKILEKNKKFKFIIAGDGPYRKKLEDYADHLRIRNKIKFTGFLSNENLMRYFKKSEFFMTASKTETQNISLIEAMASGCVPVAFDAPGINDVVLNNVNGILTAHHSEALAKSVLELSKNNTKLSNLRNGAKLRALDFHQDHVVDKLLKVYEEAVTHSKIKKISKGIKY